jgi:thiamine biosynthesis protein ThiI
LIQPIETRGAELVLVRYGELSLKGGNRKQFERTLARNIQVAIEPITPAKVEYNRGRIVVRPERRLESVARRLQDVFGASSISPAWRVEPDLDRIRALAVRVVAEALVDHPGDGRVPWRVRTTRGDKRFPLTSVAVDHAVGAHVGDAFPRLAVDLEAPALVLGVDVRDDGTYLFARRLRGLGACRSARSDAGWR